MTSRLSRRCWTLLAAAFALMTASAGPGFAAQNFLKMYIENKSTETLYYDDSSEVQEYPDSIAPGTTSTEIKPNKPVDVGETYKGSITYTNSQNSSDATCAVELKASFTYNAKTDHCDDKTFHLDTLKGTCTLVKEGDCFGSGSCGCNFAFSAGQ